MASAARGDALFEGKAGCNNCHVEPLWTEPGWTLHTPDEIGIDSLEAWKKQVNPAITTQCPDPNNPVPGTCTMHASSVDLSVLLATVGLAGAPTAPVFVPTPNHSHVVDNSRVNTGDVWWEVRPVLVMQQSDWPTADGSSGITSSKIMDDVEAAGRAVEVGSNFFLFFNSRMAMPGMKP